MQHFLLQSGPSSLNSEERMGALEAAFPAEESRTELAGRFWAQHEQIQEKLAAYVFSNKAQIDGQLRLDLKTYPVKASSVFGVPASFTFVKLTWRFGECQATACGCRPFASCVSLSPFVPTRRRLAPRPLRKIHLRSGLISRDPLRSNFRVLRFCLPALIRQAVTIPSHPQTRRAPTRQRAGASS